MTDNLPATVSDIERMAVAVSDSGLFGMKTKAEAMALMLIAHAEGLPPAIAATHYHIINGRPALKADAMLSRFQNAGGSVKWITLNDEKAEAEFYHPQGGTVTIDWDMNRAKQAQIKNPMWSKYPRQMLRSRVISEGIRSVYPGVNLGMYTEEEVRDMEPVKRQSKSIHVPDAIDVESKPLSEQMPPPRKDNPLLDRAKDFAKQVKACKQGGLDYLVMENVSLMNELSKEEPGLYKLALQRIAEKRAAFHTDPELDDAVPEFAETDADKLANQLKGA